MAFFLALSLFAIAKGDSAFFSTAPRRKQKRHPDWMAFALYELPVRTLNRSETIARGYRAPGQAMFCDNRFQPDITGGSCRTWPTKFGRYLVKHQHRCALQGVRFEDQPGCSAGKGKLECGQGSGDRAHHDGFSGSSHFALVWCHSEARPLCAASAGSPPFCRNRPCATVSTAGRPIKCRSYAASSRRPIVVFAGAS